MATLRRWQPARVQKRKQTPEKILIIAAAVTVGYLVWGALAPSPNRQEARQMTPAEIQRAERQREQAALAAARAKHLAELAERETHVRKLRAEQAREQAAMFERRYNTDRTPVGSTGLESAPAAPPVSPGFREVKPGLAAGSPAASAAGLGFRELPKWRAQ